MSSSNYNTVGESKQLHHWWPHSSRNVPLPSLRTWPSPLLLRHCEWQPWCCCSSATTPSALRLVVAPLRIDLCHFFLKSVHDCCCCCYYSCWCWIKRYFKMISILLFLLLCIFWIHDLLLLIICVVVVVRKKILLSSGTSQGLTGRAENGTGGKISPQLGSGTRVKSIWGSGEAFPALGSHGWHPYQFPLFVPVELWF